MFLEYLKLGLDHILDFDGVDHMLFLVALVVVYRTTNWKTVLVLATAFTLGHSVTLAMAAMDVVSVNKSMVEIMIAVSIAATAAYNFKLTQVSTTPKAQYGITMLFGLIHGLGFSSFFKTILGKEDLILPLFAFNIGVELAQIIIVLFVLLTNSIIPQRWTKQYIFSVSLVILLWALKLVFERI